MTSSGRKTPSVGRKTTSAGRKTRSTGRQPLRPSDFRRLWAAYSITTLGSAIGAGALGLVAILVLHAPAWQVSTLAAAPLLVAATVALPLGPWIEFQRKRPLMIGADIAGFVTLISVPIAAAFGTLTFAHLCVVAVVQALCAMVFRSASQPNLKSLVPPELLMSANSRFETTAWTAQSVGSPLGGLLVSVLGATASMAVDATSFLLSAVGVSRLQSPEPTPPQRTAPRHLRREIVEGLAFLLGHRTLRMLFVNSVVFSGGVLMSTPLLAVLMLRDLGFAPWQFGLALGLPCLGGVLGAAVAPSVSLWFGSDRTLLAFGFARTGWLGLVLLAGPSTVGLAVIIAAEFMLLFCAGIFNPVFTTYRMSVTPDHLMSRVVTTWSVGTRLVPPLFILAGGAVATACGTRTVLAVAATVIASSSLFLPWRARPAT
ncbi:MFS transporter [Williamsia sp. CHRR-6]|uniref:MFS transporter n=1 Tax=Williamsia sp. CHRR-6 TaxID=2835871 RepID=UPI001BDB257B|nr:MFS transporter [Williamsia sp. CHRR-6]MBT0567346.1 MFS transporter [Williamsia sp. CHRR-6]